MPIWDPATYLQFSEERSRPFFELTSRIGATNPSYVVDIGCGPGTLTATLANRWPAAVIDGVDSSPEMVESAQPLSGERLRFHLADVNTWEPAEPPDLVVSNATLQWVPGHRDLLPRLVDMLRPDGWLALQVPGNFTEPSHQLLADLAAEPRYADATRDVDHPTAFDAKTYLADLASLGCRVDAWETTYLHVLTGPDPVFRWISGTGARPVLQALAEEQREQFVAEYKAALEQAYPAQGFGTVLPFRRVFVVGQKP